MSALDNINPDHFVTQRGARILDIGSAAGDNAIGLKARGYSVTTLEIDPNLVARFRARPESEGIDIREGDATAMPYADDSFDGAILLEVIEHVPDTTRLLQEIKRVLKPGAILCIGVPTGYTEHIYWRLHPRYAENATHVHIFSREKLTAALNAAGFSVERIDTRNLLPAVSWMFHALLRSKSDHTGTIHEHHAVDRALGPMYRVWIRTPGLNRGLFWLQRHFGKSWYVYARA
jgi:SAM-dependent methyltransferase